MKSQDRLSLHDQAALYPVGMAFKDRFKAALKAKKMRQVTLADALGLTPQAISGWVRGETKPDRDKLPAVAEKLGTTIDWLMAKDGDVSSEDVAASLEPDPPRKLKVKGYIGADSKAGFYALADDAYTEIDAQRGDPPNAAALEILGTSAGRWMNRWYAVYTEITETVTDDMIGQPCVVWLSDDRVLVKEVRRNGKRFDLFSNDPTEPPIKNVKIIQAAKVISMRPKTAFSP